MLTLRRYSLGSCSVSHTHQKPLNADVLIKFIPVDARATTGQLIALALLRRSIQQAREVSQRHTQLATISQNYPHHAGVKVQFKC